MKPQSTPKRNYMLYTLYDPNSKVCFLGKTYGDKAGLRSILSKHLNQKNDYTRHYFGKHAPFVIPKLCVLATLNGTFRDAYKHLVAWTRLFLENGYYLAIQPGTIHNAMNLHPETASIYNSIKDLELDTFLEHGGCSQTSTSKKQKQHIESTKKQFNIRISPGCRQQFLDLCAHEGVTRDQALSMLLKCSPYTNESPVPFEGEQVKLLKSRLKEQEEKLLASQNQIQNRTHRDNLYKALPNTINQMLAMLFSFFEENSNLSCREKIRILTAQNSTLDSAGFKYPESPNGYMAVLLQGLVYVKGGTPGVFVLAQDIRTGKRLKFRYYAKTNYIGLPIHKSEWSFYNSKWIVFWHLSNDGARQLLGSIPMPLPMEPTPNAAVQTNTLNELIRKATPRNNTK